MTPAPGPWEREVRRFVLSGLVFVLFLAIASLVALRMTTRWAVAQMEHRLAAEARTVATSLLGRRLQRQHVLRHEALEEGSGFLP